MLKRFCCLTAMPRQCLTSTPATCTPPPQTSVIAVGSEPPQPRFIRQGYILLKPPWIYDIGNGLVYDDLTPCSQRVATPTAYRSRSCKMKRFVCNAAALTLAQWDAQCGHFLISFILLPLHTVSQSESLASACMSDKCGFIYVNLKTQFCQMFETTIFTLKKPLG